MLDELAERLYAYSRDLISCKMGDEFADTVSEAANTISALAKEPESIISYQRTKAGIDLGVIRKRADAATPGPWRQEKNIAWGEKLDVAPEIAFCQQENNAEFISRAREDIPALLDEIGRLTEQLAAATRERDAAKSDIEEIMGYPYGEARCLVCENYHDDEVDCDAVKLYHRCEPKWRGPKKRAFNHA